MRTWTAVLIAGLMGMASGGAWAIPGLTDTETHPPPADYETFTPADPEFPAAGDSYVDPVFGVDITRLTDIYNQGTPTSTGSGILYGINGLFNASGDRYLYDGPGGVHVIDVNTGAFVRQNVPYPLTTTDAVSFDPIREQFYYFTEGTRLRRYNITTGVTDTLQTFPGPLGGLGQSADWIDRSGRYYLLNLNNQLRIWDRTANVLYQGGIPVPSGSNGIPPGWAGLSPNGQFVILSLNPQKFSHRVNHATRTLSTTGVMFWDACFDHGDVMSATDGQTYFITAACLHERALYRVNVTNNAAGLGAAQLTLPGNARILSIPEGNTVGSGHFACAARGTYQDYCYLTIASPSDLLDNPGPWYPYKQELMVVHVPSLQVHRLAHHRARPLGSQSFCRSPRVASTWDGDMAIFASNMSAREGLTLFGCGYADEYRVSIDQD